MASEKIEIRLRAVEPSDTDWIYLLENEPSARAVSAELAPLSRQQIWEYASNYDANPLKDGHLRMIIDFAGEKVCIQVITPAQFSSRFASLKVLLITSFVIMVGFHTTS